MMGDRLVLLLQAFSTKPVKVVFAKIVFHHTLKSDFVLQTISAVCFQGFCLA